MRIELLHNRIVADCITPHFTQCFEDDLVPMLEEAYPDIDGVLMYEDHLADDLLLDGEWYYPLTVFVCGAPEIKWVKWKVDGSFKNGCPYSFTGAGRVEFSLVGEELPDGFERAIEGRAIAYREGSIRLRVVGVKKDPTFLVGRYSQTFVDELARQISDELVRVLSVERVDNGRLELQLVFAHDTYMEHTSENVTYRRLLLTDKGCQPRDFWVKWTRLDGEGGLSVRDSVSADTVLFEIGEDVPQKIREKEYRFLCRSNPDKYQSAMGKRTVTEWRELIKRAIKRGELVKIEPLFVEPPVVETPFVETPVDAPVTEPPVSEEDDLDRRLKAILGEYAAATSEPVPEVDDSDITTLARAALGIEDPVTEDGYVFGIDMPEEDTDGLTDEIEPTEEYVDEPAPEEYDTDEDDIFDEPMPVEAVDEPCEDEPAPVEEPLTDEQTAPEAEAAPAPLTEEELRREIEARVRRELEEEARARREAERQRLYEEHERLREENERLRQEARIREEAAAKAESERIEMEERRREEEAARLEEEERTRARIAEQARIEEAERARLAEIARTAVEEQKERERREAEERAAREAREAEYRRQEAERLERERLAREEEERRKREPVIITKHAKLIFRRAVDLNVISRIKEIVESTLIQERKAHVHIYMKAYPVDSYTINLDMRLPENEGELLVTLVKAIGNGHLGITKIIVE